MKSSKKDSSGIQKVLTIVAQDVTNVLNKLQKQTVTLVIPARNEEKTIAKVIKAGKKSKLVSEILVVDSFSNDKTSKVAKKNGARVVRQYSDKRGKGGAIYTAIREARGNVLVFIDADITNIETKMIDNLVYPIIKEDVDYVIAKFNRKSGRVTRLTAIPLLKLFFPEIKFKQPLSGLFAARKQVLKKVEIEEHWGIEISLLIDMMMSNYKIKEVSIGFIEHDMGSLDHVADIAEKITQVLIKRAHDYGRFQMLTALVIATYNSHRLKRMLEEETEKTLKVLERSINQIKSCDIKKVFIVTGHKGNMIRQYIDDNVRGLEIEYLENKKDIELLSILAAKNKINNRALIFFGNIIVDTEIIKKILNESNDIVFCIDKKDKNSAIKCLVERKKIKKVGTFRGNSTILNVAICNPVFFNIIEDALENKKHSLEEALKWAVWHGQDINSCNIKDLKWEKVETSDDLIRVFGE